MKSRISPHIEQIYEQLLWIERRRFRVIESVSAHFGKSVVANVLSTGGWSPCPLLGEPELASLLDEKPPLVFLRELAFKVEACEAAAITLLRSHVSLYREHVDEQIIFGSRTAGQDAGRTFLSQVPIARPRTGPLSTQEAVQAIFELNFQGLPEERNYFLMLRSHGGSTAHFVRSPHLEAWKVANAEPGFMYAVRCEWVKGILDIVSPPVEFSSAQAIEQGDTFGLQHFFLRGQHAGP